MREQLQTRLAELKQEFETGQRKLQDLERQDVYLRERLMRVSGAIQVLEELLTSPVANETGRLNDEKRDVEPIIVESQIR
jgi:hypothetical protein